MNYSGTIYFLGEYKPAYFEASSLKALRSQMQSAISTMSMDDWQWFAWRIDNVTKELRKPSCAGASHEHGCKGISMNKRKADRFLADIVATLPEYPGLKYSNN